MAKTWYAVTAIKHGKRESDDSAQGKYVRTEFAPGDKVTGLTVDEMKDLFTAGAISSRRPEWLDDEEDEEEAPAEETKPAPAKKVAPAAPPKAPAGSGN